MRFNRSRITVLALSLTAALVTARTPAHHSFAQFDRDTQQVISGVVARWAFNNPHAWLYIDVANDDGSTTLWSFEGSGPINLLRRRIDGSTFRPGDTVTLMHCPLRDGRPGGHIGWARIGDGDFLDVSDGGCDGDEETIDKWKAWLDRGIRSSTEVDD